MQISNRLHRSILVVLLVVSSTLLVGCDPKTFHRVKKSVETYLIHGDALVRGTYQINLSRLFDDVPTDINLWMELKEPHAVWIEQDGTKTELGNLTYQFPDTPIKTMVLSIGEDYFIIGWIDQSVEGTLNQIYLSSFGNPDRWSETKIFIANPQMRIFHLPIYPEDGWEGIRRFSIGTIETTIDQIDDRHASLHEFHVEYDPPIPWEEIDSWAVPVVIDELE